MPLLDDPWLPAPDAFGNIPSVRPGAPVGVYRYDGSSSFFPLPNVECLEILDGEGPAPGWAAFRYNLASGLDGAPSSIEEALGTGFVGALTVNPGDRLVVRAQRPDGLIECLFDGEAVSFGMELESDGEDVVIEALGIAWRCLDRPIAGAFQRAADNPQRIDDIQTDLVAHFNPDGLPNCTPDGYMAGQQSNGSDYRYPTFLDPLVVKNPDQRTYWTLAKAARYLVFRNNADQEFVANPDGQYLDQLLDAAGTPANSGGVPATVPDTPVTGKDWPTTLYRLVTEVGVGQRFALSTDAISGLPVTSLALFPQQGGPTKNLYLAPRGTPFSPTLFNVAASGLHRDVAEVVNSWTVVGALGRVETTIVLACGFPSTPGDASDSNIKVYDKADPTYLTTNRDKYRLYVLGETGDGYYDPGSTTALTGVTKLDGLFGEGNYAFRRRRALDCLTPDPAGIPYRPRLAISTNYAGAAPGIWDGTGKWQPVTSSTWEVLKDRVGIRITDKHPEDWEIGKNSDSSMPFPGGVARGVSCQAVGSGATPKFYLRLTCSLDADLALRQTATATGSPLQRTIKRTVDASDRYRFDVVDESSEFAPVSNGNPVALSVRDDRPAALAEATALTLGTGFGVLEGPVVVPRLTTYYQVGDRIASVDGRGLGLRTDDGTGDPVYPVVVGVRHEFTPDSQVTILDISDAGSDRRRYRRPPRRRRVSVPMGLAGGGGMPGAGGLSGPGGSGGSGGVKGYTSNRQFGGAAPAGSMGAG